MKFGFRAQVSGTRVVVPDKRQQIGPHAFVGFGASIDDYPGPYFTVAVALGADDAELDGFLERLGKTFAQVHKQLDKEIRQVDG